MNKTGSTLRWFGIVISLIFILIEVLNIFQNDFHPYVFGIFTILLALCWYSEYQSKKRTPQKKDKK